MTTSNISLKLIPANVPSLCIPRVFSNIPRDRIFRIVDDLGLGRISSIDMVPKVSEKGEKYNRIFIHFTAWSTSKDAEKARQIALSGGEFKILYDDPYFWKVSASTSIAPFAPVAATPKPATSSRPKLAFDTLDKNQSASPPLPQQKHQYPSPESRREKYGPRPVTDSRESTDQRQYEQKPRRQDQRQDQRQEQRPRRPLEQDQRPRRPEQRQDPVHSLQLKEDNAVANVNAAANLLDKLALDIKEEPKEDIALLPPPRRRGKNLKKGVAKTVVAKVVAAKAVAVSIEVEDENGLEEGEEVEVEDVNKVEENA